MKDLTILSTGLEFGDTADFDVIGAVATQIKSLNFKPNVIAVSEYLYYKNFYYKHKAKRMINRLKHIK